MVPPLLGFVMGGKFPLEQRKLDLTQAGDVIRHSLDFAIVQLGSHILHLKVVGTRAVTESIQLLDSVIGMLPGQSGVLCRNTSAVRAMAADTCGNLAIWYAATVDVLAQAAPNPCRWLNRSSQAAVANQAVMLRISSSDNIVAKPFMIGSARLSSLKSCNCLSKYSGCCCANSGLRTDRRIAISTMTSCAYSFVTGLTFDEVRFGRCIARREGRESGCCQCGSRRREASNFILMGLVMCSKNCQILQ